MMKFKNFVKEHKYSIIAVTMFCSGIVIGMRVKKIYEYEELIDTTCGVFNVLGTDVSEKKGHIDIYIKNKNENASLCFPLELEEAKEFAGEILGMCKKVENAG